MEMITNQKDGYSYFQNLSKQGSGSQCTINGCKIDLSNEGFLQSVRDAVKSVREEQSKQSTKHIVKFAGEKIEYIHKIRVLCRISGGTSTSQELDTLVKSVESKKSLTTIDKSSYDWDKYKEKEGIKEEVEEAKKNGYIEKQEFLLRVDQRQFEEATASVPCFLEQTVHRGDRSSGSVSGKESFTFRSSSFKTWLRILCKSCTKNKQETSK